MQRQHIPSATAGEMIHDAAGYMELCPKFPYSVLMVGAAGIRLCLRGLEEQAATQQLSELTRAIEGPCEQRVSAPDIKNGSDSYSCVARSERGVLVSIVATKSDGRDTEAKPPVQAETIEWLHWCGAFLGNYDMPVKSAVAHFNQGLLSLVHINASTAEPADLQKFNAVCQEMAWDRAESDEHASRFSMRLYNGTTLLVSNT